MDAGSATGQASKLLLALPLLQELKPGGTSASQLCCLSPLLKPAVQQMNHPSIGEGGEVVYVGIAVCDLQTINLPPPPSSPLEPADS